MEQNKELIFKIMVMFPEVLENAIERHNQFNRTNFKIVETIEEIEAFFCKIIVTEYKTEDIFNLGYLLSAMENKLRSEGKIDW